MSHESIERRESAESSLEMAVSALAAEYNANPDFVMDEFKKLAENA